MSACDEPPQPWGCARVQDCSFKGFAQVVRCYRIDGACTPPGPGDE